MAIEAKIFILQILIMEMEVESLNWHYSSSMRNPYMKCLHPKSKKTAVSPPLASSEHKRVQSNHCHCSHHTHMPPSRGRTKSFFNTFAEIRQANIPIYSRKNVFTSRVSPVSEPEIEYFIINGEKLISLSLSRQIPRRAPPRRIANFAAFEIFIMRISIKR
jgi:hypothetical protein